MLSMTHRSLRIFMCLSSISHWHKRTKSSPPRSAGDIARRLLRLSLVFLMIIFLSELDNVMALARVYHSLSSTSQKLNLMQYKNRLFLQNLAIFMKNEPRREKWTLRNESSLMDLLFRSPWARQSNHKADWYALVVSGKENESVVTVLFWPRWLPRSVQVLFFLGKNDSPLSTLVDIRSLCNVISFCFSRLNRECWFMVLFKYTQVSLYVGVEECVDVQHQAIVYLNRAVEVCHY